MKNNNILISLIIFFLILGGCQSVKDGLTGVKKNNNDEFLIEKKNPLTKPPDYDKLPNPDNKEVKIDKDENENFDLKKILGQAQKEGTQKSSSQTTNSDLKKSILDKIKNN